MACLPVALVATGGCLATSSDIEKLQLSMKVMQDSLHAQQVRSDSATRELTRALVHDATQQLGQQFARGTLQHAIHDAADGGRFGVDLDYFGARMFGEGHEAGGRIHHRRGSDDQKDLRR